MNENMKLMHITRMPIRWGDMDAMGHVNNAVYFRYLEQARVEWLQSAELAIEWVDTGPVVINAHCTYLRQLKYPGDIEIRTFAGAPGRSSFETMQEIRRVDTPDVLCAQGGAKVVWVNYAEEKSVPLPDELRRLLTEVAPVNS
jgi:acyl-CoA thioester hydrolase